jgi:hypothetical protein
MMKALINDPEHWLSRAEEARVIAEQMTDPQARASMLRVAQEYEKLAERAEARTISGAERKPVAPPAKIISRR